MPTRKTFQSYSRKKQSQFELKFTKIAEVFLFYRLLIHKNKFPCKKNKNSFNKNNNLRQN